MKNDIYNLLVEAVVAEQKELHDIVIRIEDLCKSGKPSDGFLKRLRGFDQMVEQLAYYVKLIIEDKREVACMDMGLTFELAKSFYVNKLKLKALNNLISYKWKRLLPEEVDTSCFTREEKQEYVQQVKERFRIIGSNHLRLIPYLYLDNAVKYSPSHNPISVEFDPVNMTVTMQNYGPKISDEDFDHLFEKGFRGERAITMFPDAGLGLGLYFMERIMTGNGFRLEKHRCDDKVCSGTDCVMFQLVADFSHADDIKTGDREFDEGDMKEMLTSMFLHDYDTMATELSAYVENLKAQIYNESCGVKYVEGIGELYEELHYANNRFLIQFGLFAYYFNPDYLRISSSTYEFDMKKCFRDAFAYFRKWSGNEALAIDVQMMTERQRRFLGMAKQKKAFDLFDEKNEELRIKATETVKDVPMLLFDFIRLNASNEPEIELTLTQSQCKGTHTLTVDLAFDCAEHTACRYDNYYSAGGSNGDVTDKAGDSVNLKSMLILDFLKLQVDANRYSTVELRRESDDRLKFHIVL